MSFLNNDNITLVIVSTLSAASSSLVTFVFAKRKYNSETDNIVLKGARDIVAASKEVIDMIKEEVETQKEHRANCESEVKKLREDVKQLTTKLEKHERGK